VADRRNPETWTPLRDSSIHLPDGRLLAFAEWGDPNGRPVFLSNNAGGILGGISTGQEIVARFAVKPTSSILTPRRTVTAKGKNAMISTKGRHDPCVGIRAVPIGEAMMACVLADHFLRHRGQTGRDGGIGF